MFGSEIIEMAIGLIFVYLTFSLICSGAKEWVHYLLNVRAKALEEQIADMLKNSAIVKTIYSHDLFKGAAQSGVFKKLLKPSVLVPAGETSANSATVDKQNISGEKQKDSREKQKEAKEKQKIPSEISPDSFSVALLECIGNAVLSKGTSAAADKNFWDVKNAIEQIGNNEVKKVLTELIVSAQKDEEKLIKKLADAKLLLEAWFDTSMEKLTQWYKRKSKQLIFVFALIITVTFNVDTIMIVKALSENPEMRTSVYNSALLLSQQEDQFMKLRPSSRSQSQPNTKSVSQPADAKPAGSADIAKKDQTPVMTTEQLKKDIAVLKSQIQNSGLPLGWVRHIEGSTIQDPRELPQDFLQWVYKIFGLLVSLMAISMGAPFWFNIMKSLLSLRQKVASQGNQQTQPPLPAPVPVPSASGSTVDAKAES